MVYLDLILNLALLVALTIVSGFIEWRWPQRARRGVLMQGVLFGGAAVLGMLRPLNMGSGLIFDGRSVMVSLCALFFGPLAAGVAGAMAVLCRLALGGVGTLMGVAVTLASVGIGLLVRLRLRPEESAPSARQLYLFGLAVHAAMVALMTTLPHDMILRVMLRVGPPVLLLYPLATVLAGKILSDQVSARRVMAALKESSERLRRLSDNLPGGMVYQIDSGEDGLQRRFSYVSAGVEALHEVTVEKVLEDATIIYSQVEAEDRPLLVERESRALNAMSPFSAEVRIRLPSGAI
ncbi:MAG: LytS/YhcK type 5TM receptor domain-containing protein, partial [Lentisphaerota bacterium]